MRAELVTHQNTVEPQYSKTLQVLEVNLPQGYVMIGSSSKDFRQAVDEVDSNDAIDLAIKAAAEAGMTNPVMHGPKQYAYYDAKTKATIKSLTNMPKTARRATIVFVSPANPGDQRFMGDSIA